MFYLVLPDHLRTGTYQLDIRTVLIILIEKHLCIDGLAL